jgi:hypothetical protein
MRVDSPSKKSNQFEGFVVSQLILNRNIGGGGGNNNNNNNNNNKIANTNDQI